LHHCSITRERPSNIAGASCFRKAYITLYDQKEVKLTACKGSMPTCNICNTANEMLRNTKRWNEAQREVVLRFQRLHLQQQQHERENLELTKKLCERVGKSKM
jgi:hypothetical protein